MHNTHDSGSRVEMLKPSDLAPRLGVTTGRVYQLIAEGLIPSVRIGRAIRVPRKAWDEWLKEQHRRATHQK